MTTEKLADFQMTNRFDPSAANDLPPRSAALLQRRRDTLGDIYPLFYRQPLHLSHGSGARLVDVEGRTYLDAYNNVPALGHAHERVARAVADQLRRTTTHTRYLTEGVVEYAEAYLATYPEALDHVIFTNSGSEANDLALQIAQWRTGHRGVIVTARAYHGTTALLAGLSPENGAGTPLHDFVRTVEPPDTLTHGALAGEVFALEVERAAADLQRSGHGVAALLVDTIFSTDGIYPGPEGMLAPAFRATRAAGGLVVADEVQPGMGRLGHGMWGFTRHTDDVDMVTCGKPMAGGLPIGSLVLGRDLSDGYARERRYFNTFGGNPVSVAAAAAVLAEILEQDLLGHAASTGDLLQRLISATPEGSGLVADVRGAGLFIGVEMAEADGVSASDVAAAVVNGLRERRVLISAVGRSGQVLKVRPPLAFTAADAHEFADVYRDVLSQLHSRPELLRSTTTNERSSS